MARTRWPPDWQPWPLAQARQRRDGTAGRCRKNLGPADRSYPKTTSGVSRIEGQAGTQATDPDQSKTAEARPEDLSTSSLPNLYVLEFGDGSGLVGAYRPVLCALRLRLAIRAVPERRRYAWL